MRWNIIVIVFFFSFSNIVGSEVSPRKYFAIKRDIDKKYEEIVRNWTRKIILTGVPPQQEFFKESFNSYQNDVNKLRNHALQKFQLNSKIDDARWHSFMESSNNLYELNASKKGTNKERLKSDQYSDSPFPIDAGLMIKQQLGNYGIYSKEIHLKGDLEDPFFYGVTVACNEHDMSCLAINRIAWRKASFELKQCMCIGMVAELVEKVSFIRRHIKYFFPKVIKSFKKHRLYYNIIALENAARVLSILSASLRSSQNASLLRKYASQIGTTYFSPDAYNLLVAIESLWQIHDAPTEYFALGEKRRVRRFILPKHAYSSETSSDDDY